MAAWPLPTSRNGNGTRAATLLKPSDSFRPLHPLEHEPAPYVGAARCAACHSEIYRSLSTSKHATTFSRPQDLNKLVLPSNPVPDPGNPQVTHGFKRQDEKLQVETRVGEEVQRAVINYAFGSRDHFMTFVGRDDQGRSRMLRISHYHSARGSGWDLSTGLPQRPDNPHEYLGTTLLEGDGVRRCLFCHTTNFRAALDQAGPEAADLAIGCETVPRAGRSSRGGDGSRVPGPGHPQSRAAAGPGGQQDVRPVPRPPRHQRDLGAPNRPRLVPLPILGSNLEPVLHGERREI